MEAAGSVKTAVHTHGRILGDSCWETDLVSKEKEQTTYCARGYEDGGMPICLR